MVSINRVTRWGWWALILPALICGEGVAHAMFLQTPPGAAVVHVPGEVWIFAAGVLVAVGVNLEQLRRARADIKRLEGKVDALDQSTDQVGARLYRFEAELNLVKISQDLHLRRQMPHAGRGE